MGTALPGIEPRELDRDRLLYLAGIALGLRLTKTGRTAEECREFGEMMVELLGYIVRRA